MKVIAKKRKNALLNSSSSISNTNVVIVQAVWYSIFIALYIWFLYWIIQDFFVLHKSILEANILNYIGSIVSISFIWIGTKIAKHNPIKFRKEHQKPLSSASNQNSACTHYLGYLRQRKTEETPSECMMCEDLIQCISCNS